MAPSVTRFDKISPKQHQNLAIIGSDVVYGKISFIMWSGTPGHQAPPESPKEFFIPNDT